MIDSDGRRRSVVDSGGRSYDYPFVYSRRNTVAVDNTNATAGPPSLPQGGGLERRSTVSDTGGRKGSMSKVVRSVKNVTKGYSSVQVKVRNGMRACERASIYLLI